MQLSERLAAALFEAYSGSDLRPVPAQPMLAIFVGIPLSGKSTLSRALAHGARQRTLHVENDAVRARLAAALGLEAPTHEPEENFLTYQTAWRLIALGLDGGAHVVHDATSLTEAGRRGAYEVADARAAPVVVVFVVTDREVLDTRAATLPPTRQEAYAKLGRRQPDPHATQRPAIVVDGACPVDANMRRLECDPHFATFFTRTVS